MRRREMKSVRRTAQKTASPPCRLEALEERVLLTVLNPGDTLTFTDGDGTTVNVLFDGPAASTATILDTGGGDIANGDNIGSIELTGTNKDAVLIVDTDGGGNDKTKIGGGTLGPTGNGGIFTTAAEDMGFIGLYGDVRFQDDVGITIGGQLLTLDFDGKLDCDNGNFVQTGGNIGFVHIDTLELDDNGMALITAGPGGNRNIGVFYANEVRDSSWNPVAPVPLTGAAILVADDAGTGSSGWLQIKLSGPHPLGSYLAIPVPGGGSVLSSILVTTDGTNVTVTALGAGGDVGDILSLGGGGLALGNVTIQGAADTDVYSIGSGGSIRNVANNTLAGDILYVEASHDIASVQTGSLGHVGALYQGTATDFLYGGGDVTSYEGSIKAISTGTLGWMPTNTQSDLLIFGDYSLQPTFVDAEAAIGTISATNIFGTIITTDGGSITSITATNVFFSLAAAEGDIRTITVRNDAVLFLAAALGNIRTFSAKGLCGAIVVASGELRTMSIGSDGMDYAFIDALAGIRSLSSSGDIEDSIILSYLGPELCDLAPLNALVGADLVVGKGGKGVAVPYDALFEQALLDLAGGGASLFTGVFDDFVPAFAASSVEDGFATMGAEIGTVSAPNIYDVDLWALAGFENISVRGEAFGLDVRAEFEVDNPNDGTFDLGAGIDKFSARALGWSDFDFLGDVENMSIGSGGVIDIHLSTDGMLESFKSLAFVEDSCFRAYDGIGSFTALGNVTETRLRTGGEEHIGDLGTFKARSVNDVHMKIRGDVGLLKVTGTATDLHVKANEIVDFRSNGLVDSRIKAYNSIESMDLGTGGMDVDSTIKTYHDLDFLTTLGLIYGRIWVDGDCGDVLTGGTAATFLGGDDYAFNNAVGVATGGQIDVDGVVFGTIS